MRIFVSLISCALRVKNIDNLASALMLYRDAMDGARLFTAQVARRQRMATYWVGGRDSQLQESDRNDAEFWQLGFEVVSLPREI